MGDGDDTVGRTPGNDELSAVESAESAPLQNAVALAGPAALLAAALAWLVQRARRRRPSDP